MFANVIVDALPLVPATDAGVFSTTTGGTVVVVGCGTVDKEQPTRPPTSLQAADGTLLGLVVDRVPTGGADAETHYYRERYAPRSADRTRKDRSRDRRATAAV